MFGVQNYWDSNRISDAGTVFTSITPFPFISWFVWHAFESPGLMAEVERREGEMSATYICLLT